MTRAKPQLSALLASHTRNQYSQRRQSVSRFFAAALALLCAPRRIIGLTFLPANNSFCAYRFAAHYEIFRSRRRRKNAGESGAGVRGQYGAGGLIKK